MIRSLLVTAAVTATLAAPARADQEPGQEAFRAIYKELLEINTTLSVGSCTEAAEAMKAHLAKAGFPDSVLHIVVPPDRPKDGNLVAVLPGSDTAAPALMLLAHIDVVEANRADWERDPFKMVEENGYFYARGAADDKAMAAVFVDSLVRFKTDKYEPVRTIKMALTCGEESPDTFNGVSYLLKNNRDLMQAGFVINEGAGGRLDKDGKAQFLGIQAGEKIYQDFKLVVTNPGGHSSRPVKDNAITHLSAGLVKIGAYDFPVAINPSVKAHFEAMSRIETGETAAALATMASDNPTPEAAALVAQDPSRNSMMRTTCVATMVTAGHAPNALPQRAEANVNCRILPGVKVDDVMAELGRIVDDPAIKFEKVGDEAVESTPPLLTPEILEPAKQVAAGIWPGVPLVPTMTTGATDGRFMNKAGIPTYGLSGMFGEPDGGGVHGLNERIRVESLYNGRTFLYRVIKLYAGTAQPG